MWHRKPFSPVFLLLAGFLAWVNCGPARVTFFRNSLDPNVGALAATTRSLRLGTREYVASTLAETFGGGRIGAVNTVIQDLVRSQLSPFGGGPCDRYAQDCPLSAVGTGRVDPAGESQSSVVPTATPARMALVIRACEKIVAQDEAVFFAAALARGEPGLDSIDELTDQDLASAFDLFFTGQTAPPYLTEKLRELARDAADEGGPLESWRFVLLALCSSPGWQIP